MAHLSLSPAIKLLKSTAIKGMALFALIGAFAIHNSYAEVYSEEELRAIAEANERFKRDIFPVYFPAVPFGWKVVIGNNMVSYVNTTSSETSSQGTTINMRYTRKTNKMDAAAYMDYYVATHSCEPKLKQGTGFYTTACVTNNTYTIVIGEPNNMYVIELMGDYNSAARAIIENYVGAIVSGKKVFYDRNIGDISTRDPAIQ